MKELKGKLCNLSLIECVSISSIDLSPHAESNIDSRLAACSPNLIMPASTKVGAFTGHSQYHYPPHKDCDADL